jgi:hypothetical protein
MREADQVSNHGRAEAQRVPIDLPVRAICAAAQSGCINRRTKAARRPISQQTQDGDYAPGAHGMGAHGALERASHSGIAAAEGSERVEARVMCESLS